MTIKNRKRASRATTKKVSGTSDSSSSEPALLTRASSHLVYERGDQDVVRWGYILLLTCWFLFVAGVGGVLGIWDRVLGFRDGQIVDLACYFSLIVVTGFVWTVLNWCVVVSFFGSRY